MLDRRMFYINGAWCAPEAARDFEVISPSTEEPCAVVSAGNRADTDRAVAAVQLSRHGGIDMISVTGATRAGVAITKAAADTVKRVTLELGGKGG